MVPIPNALKIQLPYMDYKQCWGSVTFCCGFESGSPDPNLWLMDPDPDPTPDPTTFFDEFKDVIKKKFSSYFFTYKLQLTHRYIIFSLKKFNFMPKFCVKK